MGKRKTSTAACIVDPASDHGKTQHRWPFFKERLLHLIGNSPVYFPNPERSIEDLTAQIVANSHDTILVAGDDRTFNRVANKLMEFEASARPAMGLLCASGTGQAIFNSLCPKARFMTDGERLNQCVATVSSGNEKRIDLGKVNFVGARSHPRIDPPKARYFINLATFGISSFVYDRLWENKTALHSGLAFAAAAVQSLLTYDPPKVTLRSGSRLMARDEEVFNLFIANGQFGPGGMILHNEGTLWDGKLNAVFIPELTINEVVTELPKLWVRAKDVDPSIVARGTNFRLQCGALGSLNRIDLDGVQAPAPPAVFQLERSALSIFV